MSVAADGMVLQYHESQVISSSIVFQIKQSSQDVAFD